MQEKSTPSAPKDASSPAVPTVLCMASLGEAIRILRRARRLTQIDLALATHTSPTQIHRIETGFGEDMSLTRFIRICAALSTTPDALLAAATCLFSSPQTSAWLCSEGGDSGQK